MASSDVTITITVSPAVSGSLRPMAEAFRSNGRVHAAWADWWDDLRQASLGAQSLHDQLAEQQRERRDVEHAEALVLNEACALIRRAARHAERPLLDG